MASKPLNGAPLAAAVAAVHGAIRALLLRHLATAPPVNGGGLLHGSAGLIGQIRISAFKNGFGPLCLCPCQKRTYVCACANGVLKQNCFSRLLVGTFFVSI